MLRVGLVGIGFMGWIHWLAYERVKGAAVKAICTRSAEKLAGDWTGIKGNFGPPGEQVSLKGVGAYDDLNDLLADDEIDLVDICLPPDQHVAATLKALAAGKHVFVEKPLGLTPQDCDKMVKAAEKAKRQLFVGQVLPFFPEYAKAVDLIQSGKFGKLLGGHFLRVISDPLWIKDFFDVKKVGGPLIDLHVHDAHFIRMLFGMPTAVTSVGRLRGETVEYAATQFEFADPKLVVTATSGVISQQGRPFTHGFEIHLEKATLFFESAFIGGQGRVFKPLTLLDAKGNSAPVAMGKAGDDITAFEGEIKEMLTCLAKNKTSPLLGAALARDAIVLCQKQADAVRTRKKVKV
jgi:predicted dehydrogenase